MLKIKFELIPYYFWLLYINYKIMIYLNYSKNTQKNKNDNKNN